MLTQTGFEDAAGRWWTFPRLSMANLSEALQDAKREDASERPEGESAELFAMRRVVEWAISDELIRRRLSTRQLRASMPPAILWPALSALRLSATEDAPA